jgi:hypothetical protein
MMGWKFPGKAAKAVGFIGAFASTGDPQPEIVFIIAGTLAENGGRHLQALQEICAGICPSEAKHFSQSLLNRNSRFSTPAKERFTSPEATPLRRCRHRQQPHVTIFMPAILPEIFPSVVG